jgi:hypothetical protein
MFLRDFNVKAGREEIFKQGIDMDVYHRIRKVSHLILYVLTSRYIPSILRGYLCIWHSKHSGIEQRERCHLPDNTSLALRT